MLNTSQGSLEDIHAAIDDRCRSLDLEICATFMTTAAVSYVNLLDSGPDPLRLIALVIDGSTRAHLIFDCVHEATCQLEGTFKNQKFQSS